MECHKGFERCSGACESTVGFREGVLEGNPSWWNVVPVLVALGTWYLLSMSLGFTPLTWVQIRLVFFSLQFFLFDVLKEAILMSFVCFRSFFADSIPWDSSPWIENHHLVGIFLVVTFSNRIESQIQDLVGTCLKRTLGGLSHLVSG